VVTGNGGGGLSATTCTVSIDGSTFTSNGGGGLSATTCTVSIDGSTFTSNGGGGLSLNGSDFVVTNSILAQNGGTQLNYGAVSIQAPGAGSVFAFNTLVGNLTTGTRAAGVRCIDVAVLTSCLLYDNDNGNTEGCTLDHTWQGVAPADDPHLDGAYHLTAASTCCIDQGTAVAGVTQDIDGDDRQQGLAPDLGADELQ
jgi:hypothetical protein